MTAERLLALQDKLKSENVPEFLKDLIACSEKLNVIRYACAMECPECPVRNKCPYYKNKNIASKRSSSAPKYCDSLLLDNIKLWTNCYKESISNVTVLNTENKK